MTEQQVKQLLSRYHSGKATAEEVKLLENWYLAVSREQKLDAREADFGGLKKEIWMGTLKRAGLEDEFEVDGIPKRQPLTRTRSISTVWKIASRDKLGTRRLWLASAAAVAVMTLGVWLYYASSIGGLLGGRHPEFISGSPNYANDIAPGKNTATLTLANGEVIQLSDAKTGVVIDASKLSYNDGTSITSSLRDEVNRAPGELSGANQSHHAMLTANTAKGQTYQFTLADGTKVWLNADSKLEFPSNFENKKQRIVQLSGEGYFEVAKAFVAPASSSSLRGKRSDEASSSKHERIPFIVETAGSGGRPGQRVEVLGTHFNINSYADEGATKTTLLEGSVDVNGTILKPNQQATLTAASEIQVQQVNALDAIAWKNGRFTFNATPLKQVMLQVARWYDVEVTYSDPNLQLEPISGSVSRFDKVSRILLAIEATGVVQFKINGKRIIVNKL